MHLVSGLLLLVEFTSVCFVMDICEGLSSELVVLHLVQYGKRLDLILLVIVFIKLILTKNVRFCILSLLLIVVRLILQLFMCLLSEILGGALA